jgi:hypothetical protein
MALMIMQSKVRDYTAWRPVTPRSAIIPTLPVHLGCSPK